jgi:hypothetical protein
MKLTDKLFRSWYYLQLGWQIYLALIFSIVNFIVVSHSFVIVNNPILNSVFPDLVWFGIVVSVIVFPTATLMGYIHIKHGARKAENDIGYQVNPYFARRMVNTEMILNTYLIISKLLTRTNKTEAITVAENKSFLADIETMKNFLQSRTMINKMDLAYIKTESKES